MTNIAHKIISKFGSCQALAKALSLDVATVYKWTYSKEKGGTNGLIPSRHQKTILRKARQLNLSVSPEDFF